MVCVPRSKEAIWSRPAASASSTLTSAAKGVSCHAAGSSWLVLLFCWRQRLITHARAEDLPRSTDGRTVRTVRRKKRVARCRCSLDDECVVSRRPVPLCQRCCNVANLGQALCSADELARTAPWLTSFALVKILCLHRCVVSYRCIYTCIFEHMMCRARHEGIVQ